MVVNHHEALKNLLSMPYFFGQGWHLGSTLTKCSIFPTAAFHQIKCVPLQFILSSITKTSHPIVYHQNHGHMPWSISFSLMCFNCNPFVVECQDNDLDLFNPYQLKICLSDHTIHVFETVPKKAAIHTYIYIYVYLLFCVFYSRRTKTLFTQKCLHL